MLLTELEPEPLSLVELIEYARSDIREVPPLSAFSGLPDFTVIDVREADEVLPGYLPGAINIPRGQLEFRIADDPLLNNPHQLLLLYSEHGRRSILAAYSLMRLGYNNVISLQGGFKAWRDCGLPVS